MPFAKREGPRVRDRPLVVHIIWHLDIGGGEVFLRVLTRELARRGVTQQVFTVGPPGRLAADVAGDGVPVTPFRKSTRAGLATIARMAARLARLRPAIVQTHGEAGLFWGAPAARLAGARTVSLLYHNQEPSRIKTWAARAALRQSAAVIAGSNDVARFARVTLLVPERRLRTIYCGVAVDEFHRAGGNPAAAVGPPVLVTVGRLVPSKGHATLIEAFAAVRRRHPTLGLVIVGDGPERSRLERQAESLGVFRSVTFAGTVYPTTDVLAGARLFVFPSIVEPQGLALVEACAAGVPIVASRTGGIPEMIEDGVDGLLTPPGRAADLAAAIARMLDDPAFGRGCATRARERARAFDVRAIADRYLDLYRSVASAVTLPAFGACPARPREVERR